MTLHGQIGTNASRVQPLRMIDIEPFSAVAHDQLAAVAALVARDDGFSVCALPECSALFSGKRTDQVYCSKPCKVADVKERQRVGLIVAPALLAGRIHKHAKPGSPGHALCIVARRYVTSVQSEWWQSRRDRASRNAGGSN